MNDVLGTWTWCYYMLLKQPLACSQMGQAKPVYVPPKDLGKYSPHQSSLQQLPVDSKGPREGYDSVTVILHIMLKWFFRFPKCHHLNSIMFIYSFNRARRRKPVKRTQSAPHRHPSHAKHALKRQRSSEALPSSDHEQELENNQPLISPPKTVSTYRKREPVLATALSRSCAQANAICSSLFFSSLYWNIACFKICNKHILTFMLIQRKLGLFHFN